MWLDEDYDGVQYDTEHAPDPGQLEADAIRRECYRPDFDERDCSGVYDGAGHVYSDADPGL